MESINLEPNWDMISTQFNREVKIQAELAVKVESLETLRAIQAILAPLNVALQAIHNTKALESLRETVGDAVFAIDARGNALQKLEDDNYESALYIRDRVRGGTTPDDQAQAQGQAAAARRQDVPRQPGVRAGQLRARPLGVGSGSRMPSE